MLNDRQRQEQHDALGKINHVMNWFELKQNEIPEWETMRAELESAAKYLVDTARTLDNVTTLAKAVMKDKAR